MQMLMTHQTHKRPNFLVDSVTMAEKPLVALRREKLTQSAAGKQDAFAAFLPNSWGEEEKQKEKQEHACNLI